MFIIILSLEKNFEKTQMKYLKSKIQSIVMTFGLFIFLVSGFFVLDGVSLQNNFKYLFDSYHSREDTSVSFSTLVPPEPGLVHQFFLAGRMSPKFPLPLVSYRVFQRIVCIFPSITG